MDLDFSKLLNFNREVFAAICVETIQRLDQLLRRCIFTALGLNLFLDRRLRSYRPILLDFWRFRHFFFVNFKRALDTDLVSLGVETALFLHWFETWTINRYGDLVLGTIQIFRVLQLFVGSYILVNFGSNGWSHFDFVVDAWRTNFRLQISLELLDFAAQFAVGREDEFLVLLYLFADFDGFSAFSLHVFFGRLDLLNGAELADGGERLFGVGLAHLRGNIIILQLFYSGLQVQLVPHLRILVEAGVAHGQLLVFDGNGLDATLKLPGLHESSSVHKLMHSHKSTSAGIRFEEVFCGCHVGAR